MAAGVIVIVAVDVVIVVFVLMALERATWRFGLGWRFTLLMSLGQKLRPEAAVPAFDSTQIILFNPIFILLARGLHDQARCAGQSDAHDA